MGSTQLSISLPGSRYSPLPAACWRWVGIHCQQPETEGSSCVPCPHRCLAVSTAVPPSPRSLSRRPDTVGSCGGSLQDWHHNLRYKIGYMSLWVFVTGLHHHQSQICCCMEFKALMQPKYIVKCQGLDLSWNDGEKTAPTTYYQQQGNQDHDKIARVPFLHYCASAHEIHW